MLTLCLLLFLGALCDVTARPIDKLSTTKLNVHVTPHSHDDPGWLKTADQYYTGNNASIYAAQVQYIFDSVVDELNKNKDKTFIFCEISFFERWWNEQDVDRRNEVRRLLENDQLSFVNGGWVMHDEASAHYVSMVDQTTLGHQFLLKELNYRPRVGWQIDPFGHSSTHAWLSSEVGFDALFFGRMDYQDREKRFKERAMEFIWRASASQPDAAVFTGGFSDGNYGAPPGLCFDTTCEYCRDDPAVDDPALSTYNIDSKAEALLQYIRGEASITRGNNVMVKLGADFVADNARSWYKSMDKVMAAVNNAPNSPYNVFYSDPTTFMRAKAMETGVTWPEKKDDFFPYSDSSHAFWAGYFTSRPTLKYLERQSSSFLQVLKQLTVASSRSILNPSLASIRDCIFRLTAGVGLVNHHDSITGTAKQHVTDDYKKILSGALDKAEEVASAAVSGLHVRHMGMDAVMDGGKVPQFAVCRMTNESVCDVTQQMTVGDAVVLAVYNPLPRATSDGSSISLYLSDLFSDSDDVEVIVAQLIGTETTISHNHTTVDGSNRAVKRVRSSLIPTASIANPPNAANRAPWTLVISTVGDEGGIPALGLAYFWVEVVDRSDADKPPMLAVATSADYAARKASVVQAGTSTHRATEGSMSVQKTPTELKITNGLVTVTFDRTTGLMSTLTRHSAASTEKLDEDISIDITNDFGYYRSFGTQDLAALGGDAARVLAEDTRDPHVKNREPNPSVAAQEGQPSGAYIFRPSLSDETPTRVCGVPVDGSSGSGSRDSSDCTVGLTAVTHSAEVVEVVQQFSDWASQVVRLRAGAVEVELEYTIGPIPVADEWGKEIITRFESSLHTGGSGKNLLYTDSNGREFMKRQFNYRPTWDLEVYEPVSGNYYPTSAAMYIRDEESGVQLSLLTDRGLGGASLADGAMEMMVNRRLLVDDNRGVGEALNETTDGMTHYPSFTREGDGIIASGKNYLVLSPKSSAMRDVRGAMDRIFLPLAAFITDDAAHTAALSKHIMQQSTQSVVDGIVSGELPLNVHVMSLEILDAGDAVLLRLAHQFAVGEDETYSAPVDVDVGALLKPLNPTSMLELTLSANEDKETQLANKIQWGASKVASTAAKSAKTPGTVESSLITTLSPMQIRTFRVQLQRSTL